MSGGSICYDPTSAQSHGTANAWASYAQPSVTRGDSTCYGRTSAPRSYEPTIASYNAQP